MSYLSRELEKKLDEILSLISRYEKENILYSHIREKIESFREKLSKASTPLIYSKSIFENYITIYSKLNELENILKNNSGLIVEDIMGYVDELDTLFTIYLKDMRKTYLRENIMLNTPIFTALTIYLINILVYSTISYELLAISLVVSLIALISIIFSTRNKLDLSYILLALSGLTGFIASILYSPASQYTRFTLIVYILIIITAVIYLQTIRTARSRTYKEKIMDTMKKITEITEQFNKTVKEDPLKIHELEEQAKNIFRKIYGKDGNKLLMYKINVLVMHGFKREEALKKIISMYKEFV